MENNKRDLEIEKNIQEFKHTIETYKRLIGISENMIEEYQDKIQYYIEKIKIAEERLKGLIVSQVSIEEMKECKTEYNIRFPSGKISISKDSIKMVKPAIEDCPDKYKKISFSVNWEELKKNLQIVDGNQVIDKSTGEICGIMTEKILGGEIKIKLF